MVTSSIIANEVHMQIFRATDIRVSAIPVIADDVHHASHLLLNAFYEGLGHWPGFSYAIGPWIPPADMAPEILRRYAEQHIAGLARFAEGWELHQAQVG
jgi:hypothetical protein